MRRTDKTDLHAREKRVHSKIIAQGPRWRCTRPVRAASNRTVYIAYTRAGCIVWESHFVSLSLSLSLPSPSLLPLSSRFLFLSDESYARLHLYAYATRLHRGRRCFDDKYNACAFMTHTRSMPWSTIRHSATRLTIDTCCDDANDRNSERLKKRCVYREV